MTELDPTSRVDRKNPINKPAPKIKRGSQAAAPASKEVDRVTLSSKAPQAAAAKPQTSSEIRKDLVQKFRTVLEEGSYQVKAQEIADKMVQKIRENKNRLIL